MKSVSGLSLIIHLAIIAGGTLLRFVLGERRWEEFKRTFSSNGTSVSHLLILQSLSIIIIVTLAVSMSIATFIAIRTASKEGSREPQVIFVKKELRNLSENVAEAYTLFMLESYNHKVSDLTARSLTYVRTATSSMR